MVFILCFIFHVLYSCLRAERAHFHCGDCCGNTLCCTIVIFSIRAHPCLNSSYLEVVNISLIPGHGKYTNSVFKWMCGALELDKSVSASECGDLREYLRGRFYKMFSHMFPRLLDTELVLSGHLWNSCTLFTFVQVVFPPMGTSIWPIHPFMDGHKSDRKKKLKIVCQCLGHNTEINLYHWKVIHPNIITVRGVSAA